MPDQPPAYDVLVVGGGPGGAATATICAAAGLRTLVIERATFPREKVCGDCLNPSCWPVLERLGVADAVRGLPHAALASVEFVGIGGRAQRVELPAGPRGEIAVKRSALDSLLLDRALRAGAELAVGAPVTEITRAGNAWTVRAGTQTFHARTLVAADGRNSTIARLLGLLPAARKDRVGLQTHLSRPGWAQRVQMRLLPFGYCGIADVGGGEINLCLVARPPALPRLKAWAESEFSIAGDPTWRTITPLDRAPLAPMHEGLLLVGDAAQVVEPFTGEGIYYALATGIRAAEAIVAGNPARYAEAHAALYRGRLWVNRLARLAVLHPQIASAALRLFPNLLGRLTAKITAPSPEQVR